MTDIERGECERDEDEEGVFTDAAPSATTGWATSAAGAATSAAGAAASATGAATTASAPPATAASTCATTFALAARRLSSPTMFWVKRALNPTTALIWLKVATFNGSCSVVMKNVRPSAQGGVVRDPA